MTLNNDTVAWLVIRLRAADEAYREWEAHPFNEGLKEERNDALRVLATALEEVVETIMEGRCA